MKIIVVNISKTIIKLKPDQATKRAWKLNIMKAKNYEFIIGNDKGKIHPFKILNTHIDDIHNDRIRFDLEECSDTERSNIKKYIEENIKDKEFKYVTTKYIN